jgi:predicted Zn-dependent protease
VTHSLQDITQHVIDRAKKTGASAADVMIREDDTFSVTVRMTEVETLKEAISRGLMLRVFVGKRTATSHTSDLSLPVLDQLVGETVEMARLTSEDESGGLPDSAFFQTHFPDLNLLDRSWETLTPDERINLAVRAEKAAFSTDKAITNSEGASFDYARSRVALSNTAGFSGEYEGTTGAISCVPIAQANDAMQRDYWMSAASAPFGVLMLARLGHVRFPLFLTRSPHARCSVTSSMLWPGAQFTGEVHFCSIRSIKRSLHPMSPSLTTRACRRVWVPVPLMMKVSQRE